jgi:hypothetical protein
MLFATPETTLASTIGPEDEESFMRERTIRPAACEGPPTTFQSLTRRLNNLKADAVSPHRTNACKGCFG